MKTPDEYIVGRVERILTVLDSEDRDVLEAHITSKAATIAKTTQQLSMLWRSLWGLSLVLGVMMPLSWYAANKPVSHDVVQQVAAVCPEQEEKLSWYSYSDGLNVAKTDTQTCVAFTNGTVTCIPKFKQPDHVEMQNP